MSEGLPSNYIPKALTAYNEDEIRILLNQTQGLALMFACKWGEVASCQGVSIEEISESIHGISLVLALSTFKPDAGASFRSYLCVILRNQASNYVDEVCGRGIQFRPEGKKWISSVSIDAPSHDEETPSAAWETEIVPEFFSEPIEEESEPHRAKRLKLESALQRLANEYPHYHKAVLADVSCLTQLAGEMNVSPPSINHYRTNGKIKLREYVGTYSFADKSKALKKQRDLQRAWQTKRKAVAC